jgi:hypothetical protein
MVVRARRLDDRIRELCAEAVDEKNSPKVGAHPRRIAIGHSSVHAEAQKPHSGKSSLGPLRFRQTGERLPATEGVRHFLRSTPKLNGKAPGTASVTIASWLSLSPEVHDLRDR